jgi:hypothetical protein
MDDPPARPTKELAAEGYFDQRLIALFAATLLSQD